VPARYKTGRYFSEGLAAVRVDDTNWTLIDSNGENAIRSRFRWIGSFSEGLCSVEKNHAKGFIDRSGSLCVEPRFMQASEFREGTAFASPDGDSFGYIERSGCFIIKPQFQEARRFSCGLGAVRRDGFWGFVDHCGTVRIPFQFEGPRAGPFMSGFAGVCSRGLWGFIDGAGDFAIKPQFADVRRFAEGHASVCLDAKWGFVDTTGRMRLMPRFDELGKLDCGMAFASVDGKAGFVSLDGKWVIPPDFEQCFPFVGDLAAVRRGDTWQYIRRDGQAVWKSEPHAIVQAPPFSD